MAAYIESAKNVGRLENAIGWYHSHPGYGCWLSGTYVFLRQIVLCTYGTIDVQLFVMYISSVGIFVKIFTPDKKLYLTNISVVSRNINPFSLSTRY